MKRFKGKVLNKVIVPEQGVELPEGTEVEIRMPRKRTTVSREEAFQRVMRNRIDLYVGIDEIIEEDKREREERWDRFWEQNGK